MTLLQWCADLEEDANDLDEISSRLMYHCSIDSNLSSNRVVDTSKLTPLLEDEVREVCKIYPRWFLLRPSNVSVTAGYLYDARLLYKDSIFSL